MTFYNGYSPQERRRKLRALHRLFPNRSHPYFQGPCHMCGDPTVPVAPHSEDYAEPFRWERPAVYALCARCHARLHRRFQEPEAWAAYKLHLLRGGYSSDLKDRPVIRELAKVTEALAAGRPIRLPLVRPVAAGPQWWEQLTIDPRCITASWPRPR